MIKLIAFSLLVSFILALNTQPYIGIWTQPSSYDNYPPEEYSYLAASYVKYIEMAGARVVPIQYDGDQAYYDKLLTQLNGALFTGGDSDIDKGTVFATNAQYFFNKVKQLNDSGNYFPLWGTCMGFQLLLNLSNDLNDCLTTIDDEAGVNHFISIENFGTFYASMPQQLVDNALDLTIQYYNHHFCLSESNYRKNSKINSFFNLLATAENDQGDTFVTTIEAFNYPFWGVQFHPEKANFEWKVSANHTIQAIENSQYHADFFVQQSRYSKNKFASENEANKAVIYNYSPVQVSDSSFEQLYFFKNLTPYQPTSNNQQEQGGEGKLQNNIRRNQEIEY